MAGVIAAITGPSPDVIERWPPNKTLAYFDTAIKVRRALSQRGGGLPFSEM